MSRSEALRRIRVNGTLLPVETAPLDAETTRRLATSILNSEQIARLDRDLELDCSFGIEGYGRFRVNSFYQRGSVACVLRSIPSGTPTFEQLGMPVDVCKRICNIASGLVLFTGVTGSGKSTSLAAMIDHINETRSDHIVTIEDPVEFVHEHKSCMVTQREVGDDTRGFKNALKSVLRQDPDIVLVGELRDHETIEAALTLAETGHLTFGTLHTSDAVQTMNRIIDVFPADQQDQVRTMLVVHARGGLLSEAAADGARGRTRARGGDHAGDAGHPRAHPRRQGAPDLLAHPDRRAAGHDHHVPVAREAGGRGGRRAPEGRRARRSPTARNSTALKAA